MSFLPRRLELESLIAAFTLLSMGYTDAAEYKAQERSAPYLEIRSNEAESDTILRATCPNAGVIDLRIGAEFQVGGGDGKSVNLVLQSGGKTARIKGISLPSADQQMTGGTELVASVPIDDPIFEVLAAGAPIRFTGSIKETKVALGASASAALKRFLDRCKPK
jgi:hypothetical protein